ncbi:Gfo/Idh/MocA family protein [Plantibacter cousiniae (nom. nud.)]|uniref:Gfo/Idh/MocA family protein n=1 Tax=Plantibacter cousiniae (nom. nud.) TaxID=199709 RepID=UPI001D310210|nr:Gfo/Idh/MocA family oxidoreductase [Plantibacter cousiniae]CAH0226526.1 scyllo-inositol 2-dehydrogenase (NADP(+)) [Plantibacter cousiniae]
MRLGLVGYGFGGRTFHAPFVAALGEGVLAGVVTRSAARRAELAVDHPGVPVYDTVDDLLAAGVDIVTISTPPSGRLDIAKRVIDAGVPVIVDKPMASSIAEARELVAYAADRGVLLSVFQNRRWDSEARTLQAIVRSGAVGDIRLVENVLDRWEPRATGDGSGGGQLLDLGSHTVDQVRDALGPVERVFATIDRRPGDEYEYAFDLLLEHQGGIRSMVASDVLQPDGRPRLRVTGSTGTVTVRGLDLQTDQVLAGLRPADHGWGVEPHERWGTLTTTAGEQRPYPRADGRWQDFYAGVREAIDTGSGVLPVAVEGSLATFAILEAARRSAELGTWVHVSSV